MGVDASFRIHLGNGMPARFGYKKVLVWLAAGAGTLLPCARAEPLLSPTDFALDRPEATRQLVVIDVDEPREIDRTRAARFSSSDPSILVVDATGLVEPRGDGQAQVIVQLGERTLRANVQVSGQKTPTPVSFRHEVIPILTKAGCNAGGCHGKAEGQNGFRLSVFGFDPEADHEALVMQGRGRRVSPGWPSGSLLLAKATAAAPHGGGLRVEHGSRRYRLLLRWIAEGAELTGNDRDQVVSIEVRPKRFELTPGATRQLRVTARYANGAERCVTADAEYACDTVHLAQVDGRGYVQASDLAGQAAILVRYAGQVAVSHLTTPRAGVTFVRPPEVNFIDHHVWNHLAGLGIQPRELAADSTFLRRAFLDAIGVLPTPHEAQAFLDSTAPDKRSKLIDELLSRPEYADYWTMRWSDLLRVDKDKITPEGAVAVSRWLRRQFVDNRRYDEFVRAILTAQGDTRDEGPAALYLALDTPEIASRSFSQLFLGVRIECAQCHHHPFERWAPSDYFGLAGFFTGVRKKPLPGGSQAIVSRGGTDAVNPRDAKPAPTKALGAAPPELSPARDRRVELANWLTSPQNPYFAREIVNRLWAHFFGRGLVEPIDDLRETNPASHEPLLAALAARFIERNYDLKDLIKTLMESRAYQLRGRDEASRLDDERNFSFAIQKALPAEVLLDAVSQATESPEAFNGWPSGYRAVQVWDNRMPSYFLRIFGRPVRASVCECERSSEPSVSQALHLLNSPEILAKIESPQGRARRLANSDLEPAALVDELFLATLARKPTEDERAFVTPLLSGTGLARRAAIEDLLWALVNDKDFLYNR